MFFKQLSPQEDLDFRQYALDNDPPDIDNWSIYHPVCREVWLSRGIHPETTIDTIDVILNEDGTFHTIVTENEGN